MTGPTRFAGRRHWRVIRSVRCSVVADVVAPAVVELQLLPALAGSGELVATLDGRPVPVEELAGPHGGRLHLLRPGAGRLEVLARAEVDDVPAPEVEPLDASVYLRPSRYVESDRLLATAAALPGSPWELLHAVPAWVASRVRYEAGSSRATDGAVATLLAGAGVCRDFAHLCAGLLRARDVPARVVGVYAPGLAPMDLHAVTEALVDGSWWCVDATGLAPRSSLVRVATGRDAADTAWMSSHGGDVQLRALEVTAVVHGALPGDPGGPAVLGRADGRGSIAG